MATKPPPLDWKARILCVLLGAFIVAFQLFLLAALWPLT